MGCGAACLLWTRIYKGSCPSCRDGYLQVFGCDLRAYDALVVLKDEALPRALKRLQPSALQLWIGTDEAEAAQPCSNEGLDATASKRSRAIVSHIPRSELKNTWFCSICHPLCKHVLCYTRNALDTRQVWL